MGDSAQIIESKALALFPLERAQLAARLCLLRVAHRNAVDDHFA